MTEAPRNDAKVHQLLCRYTGRYTTQPAHTFFQASQDFKEQTAVAAATSTSCRNISLRIVDKIVPPEWIAAEWFGFTMQLHA